MNLGVVFISYYDFVVLLLQVQYFVYPLLELVDILVFALPHGLIPLVTLAFDLLPYPSKVSVAYGLAGLVEYHLDNVGVRYPLNR